jgi:hypothetical protein
VAASSKDYGQMSFQPAVASFPSQDTDAVLCLTSVGLKIINKDTSKEYLFPVARIRCWKVRHGSCVPWERLDLFATVDRSR